MREVVGVVVGVEVLLVLVRVDLDVFGEVDDERKLFESVFINTPNTIVNKLRAQQQRKRKNPTVVVSLRIQSPNPLRIYNDHIYWSPIRHLSDHRPSPDPKSLCAGVNGGTNSEPG